jgi:ribosomal protein S9
MRTNKIFRIASFVMLLAITLPASSAMMSVEIPKTSATENTRVEVLTKRLEEIKAMDKSNMTITELKDLRNEVKDIKKEMKAEGGGMSGGVYLSIGAIIIVILILILIL